MIIMLIIMYDNIKFKTSIVAGESSTFSVRIIPDLLTVLRFCCLIVATAQTTLNNMDKLASGEHSTAVIIECLLC